MSTAERGLGRRDLLRGRWRAPAASPAPVRPPGAVAADRFASLCDGCGDCARACPANAIRMTAAATPDGTRTPEVVAADAPCVMCEGLVCAGACPTGALAPVSPETMRIAAVAFHADACWARQGMDPDCDYCFDRCPLKGVAITYRRGHGPEIDAGHCTGCGTCVNVCPATPKALSLRAV